MSAPRSARDIERDEFLRDPGYDPLSQTPYNPPVDIFPHLYPPQGASAAEGREAQPGTFLPAGVEPPPVMEILPEPAQPWKSAPYLVSQRAAPVPTVVTDVAQDAPQPNPEGGQSTVSGEVQTPGVPAPHDGVAPAGSPAPLAEPLPDLGPPERITEDMPPEGEHERE